MGKSHLSQQVKKSKREVRLFSRGGLRAAFIFCTLAIVTSPNVVFAQIFSNYDEYVAEYNNLANECQHHLRGPDQKALFNFENCRWRKDQILMRKYRLYEILYESSYDRYEELFEAARAAATGKIKGQGQWMETWAWSMSDIEYDYETVQSTIIRRFAN